MFQLMHSMLLILMIPYHHAFCGLTSMLDLILLVITLNMYMYCFDTFSNTLVFHVAV